MTINSKRKGKSGELEAAAKLRELFDVDARRGRQYHGQDEAPDVVTSIPGVHFEIKRTERLNVYDALAQAREDGGERIPVVLHRRSRKEWVAIVPLDDLPMLARILTVRR